MIKILLKGEYKMKILLAYCKTFFNPYKDSRYKNASAGINARTLFEVLSQYGEVDYIDTSEAHKVNGRKYDIFIGINANFNEILNSIQCKKSIYYAVTQHPKEFNNKLLTFQARKKFYVSNESIYGILKKTRLDRRINIAWKNELKMKNPDLSKVDHILVIGNKVTGNSFCKVGIERKRIDCLSYELMKGAASGKKKKGKRIKLVFPVANIYLGKGFDIFYQMMYRLYKDGYRFDITIMGECSNPYYLKLIKDMKHWNLKVDYTGMVYDEHYYDILKEQDFCILPSLSEGQAGTVLDSMYCGIIPVITKEAGIDFSPLGYLLPRMNSGENYSILKRVLNTGKAEIELLSRQTAEYYNSHNLGFKERLDSLIKGYIGTGI